MKLIEADGKKILLQAGIPVPRGILIHTNVSDVATREISFPGFIKAQILQGRRGRQGLVVRCERREDLPRIIDEFRGRIGEIPCAGVYLEEAIPHEREVLVSLLIDRRQGGFQCCFSEEGGMSVSTARTYSLRKEDDVESMEDVPPSVRDVVRLAHRAMKTHDILEMEINPLAILADGSCAALDAKIELDDAAAFRHPEWSEFKALSPFGRPLTDREQSYAAFLQHAGHRGTFGRYLELEGDIALILSGGGASLVALDALRKAGGCPANYCEMSGNPDPDAACQAAKIVLSHPGIRAVWIAGSYANFTDIDATVKAVLRAIEETGLRVPVCIRRDGPQAETAVRAAKEWSARTGISVHFDRGDVPLEDSARTLMSLLNTVAV